MSWVYFPLQFKYWCLNPSCDCTEAKTFKEVIQAKWAHKGGALILDLWSHGAGILIKEIPDSLLSLPSSCEESWQHRRQGKKPSSRAELYWKLDLVFSSLHHYEKTNNCYLSVQSLVLCHGSLDRGRQNPCHRYLYFFRVSTLSRWRI